MEKDENVSVEFFEQLSDYNILFKKIGLDCPNTNEEMWIDYNGGKAIFTCPECEEDHRLEDLRFKNILYSLDTREFEKLVKKKKRSNPLKDLKQSMLISAREKDEKINGLSSSSEEKVIDISTRKRGRKMKIFIGSSQESKGTMESIARVLEDCSHEPLTWSESGVFIAGEYTYDSLIEVSKKVDAAIFIFSSDDDVWYRGDLIKQARDNVLIEYGLFTGALGRKKVIMCVDGNTKIASDLKGITHIKVDPAKKFTFKESIESWLNNIENV